MVLGKLSGKREKPPGGFHETRRSSLQPFVRRRKKLRISAAGSNIEASSLSRSQGRERSEQGHPRSPQCTLGYDYNYQRDCESSLLERSVSDVRSFFFQGRLVKRKESKKEKWGTVRYKYGHTCRGLKRDCNSTFAVPSVHRESRAAIYNSLIEGKLRARALVVSVIVVVDDVVVACSSNLTGI